MTRLLAGETPRQDACCYNRWHGAQENHFVEGREGRVQAAPLSAHVEGRQDHGRLGSFAESGEASDGEKEALTMRLVLVE